MEQQTYTTEETANKSLDRIRAILTDEDISTLRDMHIGLSSRGYDLADNVEHLACYLDNGENTACSMQIGDTKKRIIVKPELRLETRILDTQLAYNVNAEHPFYDSNTVGDDREKQRIDAAQYEARRRFVEGKGNSPIPRREILELELRLRNKDIRDHRLYLWDEMHRPGTDLCGKLDCYGNVSEGIFLTITVAHWMKEQGRFFCERSQEHYADLGVPFKWKTDMESAVVLEVKNGEIKHYPIVCDDMLISEAIGAQVPMIGDLVEQGAIDILGQASMTYRIQEDEIRNNHKNRTGIFVLPSSLNRRNQLSKAM